MPPSLDKSTREQVRRLWFLGETRKDVATAWGIGTGCVTNIVNEWTKGLEESESDIEGVRELAVQLKKEGSTLAELTSIYRRHSYIKKLGVDEDQIEFLIVNLLDGVKSVPQEKITGFVIQLFELSESESIAPVDVPNYVKQKMEQKQILDSTSGRDFAPQKRGYSNGRRVQEIKGRIEE